MHNIVACVVTYNRIKKLKKCIESLLLHSYQNFDIVVVDNGSSDGTREYLKELSENNRIDFEETDINIGGAGGFNFAIKSTYYKYEYLWLMDDDTYPKNDALENIVNKIKFLGNSFGYMSSLVLWNG